MEGVSNQVIDAMINKERACAGGARVLWTSASFRRSVAAALVLSILGVRLLPNAELRALWAACACLLPLAEATNDAIETVVDRISPEWNALSRDAKDLGSCLLPVACLPMLAVAVASIIKHLMRQVK